MCRGRRPGHADRRRAEVDARTLTLEQIGFRRQIRANFQGLARQEYAEDAESCFLASGDSVFEIAAIDARVREVHEPVEREHNGEMEIWLSAQKGKAYLVALDPAGGGQRGRLLGNRSDRFCHRDAMRGVCRARGRTGAGAVRGGIGAAVQRCVGGGGTE